MGPDTPVEHAGIGAATSLDPRWFLAIALSVPMLLAAGVYWLHRLPQGEARSDTTTVVHVSLVPQQEAVPLSRPVPVDARPAKPEGHQDLPVEAHATDLADPVQSPVPPKTESAVVPSAADVAVPLQQVPAQPAARNVAANFQKALLNHIARYRRYPSAARREALQGVVQVVFAMRRDGSLLDVWVETSSGQSILDAAAVDTIRRAQPLPAIPTQLPNRLKILVPIAFSLPKNGG